MAFDGVGLAVILVFYAAVAGVGIWAGWKNKGKGDSQRNGHIVGGRDINMAIGIFTMTATWVGGGYINGSAEAVFVSGLAWCQSPIGYSISMVVGGLFYVRKIRSLEATTMIDPIQRVFGQVMGSLLVIPAVFGELLWSASILAALGTTLAVILNLPVVPTIIVSAAIAVFYTLFGGIYAVAYTDVIQLILMIIGLFLAIPFILTNDAMPKEGLSLKPFNITTNETIGNDPVWVGTIEPKKIAKWIDSMIMLIFGGLPWQAYFQRVLSANTDKSAQVLSFAAPAGCILLVIPPVIIGAAAKVLQTSGGWAMIPDLPADTLAGLEDNASSILPLALKYLCPKPVAYIGLGAVAAAVMSSTDSSLLSAASLLTANVFQEIYSAATGGKKISNRVGSWILKGNVLLLGVIATVIAIVYKSVYKLFYFCSDLVFTLVFPHLTTALFCPEWVNPLGSAVAFGFGALMRLLSGEEILNIPPYIKWPFFDEENDMNLFPFKSFCMLLTLLVLLLFSFIFRKLGLEDSVGSLRLRIPLSEGLTKYARNETVDDDLPEKEDLGNTNDAYDNAGTSEF